MNRRRVVIIEAERLTTLYYRNIFTKLKFEHINHINYTAEIISNLRILEPDLILIDVAFLDEQLALNIVDKLLHYDSEKPLAIVSSLFFAEIIKKLKLFPNSEFFLKPLDPAKFSSSVENLLRAKSRNIKSHQNSSRPVFHSDGILKRLINIIL